MSGRDPAAARGMSDEPSSNDDGGAQSDQRCRSAEPLRASWRPAETARERQPKVAGLKKLTATFGWRAYLVPILLVEQRLSGAHQQLPVMRVSNRSCARLVVVSCVVHSPKKK